MWLQVVANYYGNRKQYEPVEGREIHWAGEKQGPPPDTPECGFDGSGCPSEGNYISSVSISLLSVGLIRQVAAVSWGISLAHLSDSDFLGV